MAPRDAPRPRSSESPASSDQAITHSHPNQSSVARTASGAYPNSPPPSSSSSHGPAFFAGQTSANIGGGQFINQQGAQVYTFVNIHNSNPPPPNNQAECQKCCTHGPPTDSGGTRRIVCAGNSNVEHQPQTESPTELEHSNEIPSHAAHVGSSWGNGSATSHVKRTPVTNYLKHLIELACGLERLHNQDIIHGDLRSDNTTRLLGSGNSRSPVDAGKSKASSESDDPRWLAPEVVLDKMVSKHSDVWSFGMVCLEILSGNHPFAELKGNLDVVRELLKGNIPKRPGGAAVERGLSDPMWELLCRCWQKQPESRPSVLEVTNTLLILQGHAPAAAVQPLEPLNRSATFPLTEPGRPGTHLSTSSEPGVKPPTPPPVVLHGIDGDESSSEKSSAMTQTTAHDSNSSSSNTSFRTSSGGHSSHKVQTSHLHHSQLPPLDLEDLPHTSSFVPPHPRNPSFTHNRVTSCENDHDPDIITIDSGAYAPPGSPEAVTTLAAVVALDLFGKVQGGTLEGLLDRLITNINSTDVQYGDILLTACAELTTSDHLFSILSTRFYEVKRDPRKNSQERVTIQLNTLMVMKHWLSVRCLTGETQLLVQVRSFCELAAQMETSETMTSKAIELIDLIDCMREGTISPYHPGQPMFQRSQMTPRNLAIALTLLEGDKYTALTPTDYILHLQGGPAANRVEDARTTNNLIIQWIQDYILCPDTVRGRAEAIRLFINTAQECRNLRNFASFVAIISALHSPPIARLKMTKAELEVPMQRQLESLQNKINPSSNYSRYRKLLKQSSRTEERDRCVPWLSVHLEDLRKPLSKHHTLRKVDGRMLINFCRYVKFMDQIKEVLPYCAPDGPDLEDFREQGRLAYLEHQLRRVEAAAQSADDFMERSKARELYSGAQERLKKLKGLGFRTSQS